MLSPFFRLNDNQSFQTKYSVGVGRLQRRRKEGEGHWLFANRKAEQQRNRNELRGIKEAYRNEYVDTPHGGTLDADFLLRQHCVAEPSQLCSINISERNLSSVNPEDLKLFTNVAHVDASINSLTLGSFCCFRSLRELSLALNGIRDMTLDAADFPHLKVLDLSFNHVSAQGLVSLAQLPSLKTLHLTGNQLHRLPPFSSSDHDQALLLGEEEAKQFEALEVLMLDNNKLTFEVFYSLMNLTKLKHLNLQGNRISAIPLLKVGHSSKPEQLSAEDEAQFHSNMDEYLKIMQTQQTEKDSKGCSLPLPELQHLNLAENKISTEEELLGAALFPKLGEIIIHSNPLTTKRRGLPMLTYYLQERRGIEIKRNQEQNDKKLSLKSKMEENFRKMSKKPCLLDPVRLTETQNDKHGKTIQETTESKGRNSTNLHKDIKHFFITEGEDEFDFELMSSSKKKETTKNSQRNRTNPEESTINKMIQTTEMCPDELKSIGIQTAVRMLEHRLRNLNVYRDSKPKLDSIQTPYTQREKKIKELPPIRPKNRPSQMLEETMKEIKASTPTTITPLAEALSGKGVNRKDCKQAQSLLKDLKMKHQMVFERAWAPPDQS